MRRKSRTFFLASRLFPPGLRSDVETLYAYFRTIDDLVDEPRGIDAGARLGDIRRQLLGSSPPDDLVGAVRAVARRHEVPLHLFLEVVDGATFDLSRPCFATFSDLERYADLVAGSVGAVLCHLFGSATPPALERARQLGVAMQLTNVIRDVPEDLHRGRLYIPAQELESFGCSISQLRSGLVNLNLVRLLQFQIARARAIYAEGLSGLPYLRRSARPGVLFAAAMYAAILERIEAADYDIFSRRPVVGRCEKLGLLPLALRAAWGPASVRSSLRLEDVMGISSACRTGKPGHGTISVTDQGLGGDLPEYAMIHHAGQRLELLDALKQVGSPGHLDVEDHVSSIGDVGRDLASANGHGGAGGFNTANSGRPAEGDHLHGNWKRRA